MSIPSFKTRAEARRFAPGGLHLARCMSGGLAVERSKRDGKATTRHEWAATDTSSAVDRAVRRCCGRLPGADLRRDERADGASREQRDHAFERVPCVGGAAAGAWRARTPRVAHHPAPILRCWGAWPRLVHLP